ncbi:hypothetical protein [Nitratifractor sp.]
MPKEAFIDLYLLLFLLIVGIGSVAGYIYYLREKGEAWKSIQSGTCPRCRRKTILLTDRRGGGCGPKLVTYTCTECGYQNSFSIHGSCGI